MIFESKRATRARVTFQSFDERKFFARLNGTKGMFRESPVIEPVKLGDAAEQDRVEQLYSLSEYR